MIFFWRPSFSKPELGTCTLPPSTVENLKSHGLVSPDKITNGKSIKLTVSKACIKLVALRLNQYPGRELAVSRRLATPDLDEKINFRDLSKILCSTQELLLIYCISALEACRTVVLSIELFSRLAYRFSRFNVSFKLPDITLLPHQ